MKKFLGILVLGTMLATSPAKSGAVGMGELKLHPAVVDHFIDWLKGGYGKKPMVFYVTIDGQHGDAWYCPEAACEPGGHTSRLKQCKIYFDKECKLFARRRTIVWKNDVNPGGKKAKINSKWSRAEIIAKLKELGFAE